LLNILTFFFLQLFYVLVFCFGALCAKLRFNWLWMNHLHVDVCILNKSNYVSFCFFFSQQWNMLGIGYCFLYIFIFFARNLILQCFLIYFTCDAIKFGFVWNIVIWTKCLEIYTTMSISYGHWNFGLFWNLSNLCIKTYHNPNNVGRPTWMGACWDVDIFIVVNLMIVLMLIA